jgi:hypothetical protein
MNGSAISGPVGMTHIDVESDFLRRKNVVCLPSTPQVQSLLTIIRNAETPRADFVFYSDRLIRLLIEEGIQRYHWAIFLAT